MMKMEMEKRVYMNKENHLISQDRLHCFNAIGNNVANTEELKMITTY